MRWLVLGALVLAACAESAGRDAAVVAGDASASRDAVAADAAEVRDAAAADGGVLDAAALDAAGADAAAPDAAAPDAALDAAAPDAAAADAEPSDAGAAGPFTLTSPAFAEGGAIPARHTCGGVDVQPELVWSAAPAGTMSFAMVLIDDDIDYVHWVAFNLPAGTSRLDEGASDNRMLPAGTMEARAYGTQYRGPCPGMRHQYTFRVYALDSASVSFTAVNPIRARHLDAAFDAHRLGVATLTGTYTP